MRRFLFAVVAVVCLFATQISPSKAAAEWCEHDPLVILTTPQGKTVQVHVTTYALGTQYAANLDRAVITYVAIPTRSGAGRGTRFEVFVLVPEGPRDPQFKTRAVLSSGPDATGTVYDEAEGRSNRPMRLTFEVAIP
jgi:hypothetical protein